VAADLTSIKTVFIILLENHDWSTIKSSANCPYINNSLLPIASYSGLLTTMPGIHPSEPNYLWLEAGTNFGVLHDSDPAHDHQASTNHLVTLLNKAGISWRAYQEDINGLYCPVANTNEYAVRHNPFVYFDDVRSDPAYCVAHIRPYTELAGDLRSNTVARYNFLTPNLCHDMHDLCGGTSTRINGDNWLAAEVPKILNSTAYKDRGALFITWDEGSNQSDGPLGMIVLSPLAKGHGYTNSIRYTHSSTLRTMQEIFDVRPFLGAAANANDLSDLFNPMVRLASPAYLSDGSFKFQLIGLTPGMSNVIQASTDLINWSPINTNAPGTNTLWFIDTNASGFRRFYRVLEQF
jgi:hypothetical protein